MLEKMLEARPDDPFVRYALAMEYRKLGRIEDALAGFRDLTERSPDYVPTYLMYGQTLLAAGRADEARAVFERGRKVAEAAGDDHAARELAEAIEGS
ncbi:MAG: hypothetical protein D6705_16775 [Deltaproteobacteria bacterium]|nr:MAG: hypothetical protein D6705_16775 [Deltaproteobacteria bacterium]